MEPRKEVHVDAAAQRRDAVLAVHDAIQAACRIVDLDVEVDGAIITLSGTAPDEATCEHAATIASHVWPEVLFGVINRLTVRK